APGAHGGPYGPAGPGAAAPAAGPSGAPGAGPGSGEGPYGLSSAAYGGGGAGAYDAAYGGGADSGTYGGGTYGGAYGGGAYPSQGAPPHVQQPPPAPGHAPGPPPADGSAHLLPRAAEETQVLPPLSAEPLPPAAPYGQGPWPGQGTDPYGAARAGGLSGPDDAATQFLPPVRDAAPGPGRRGRGAAQGAVGGPQGAGAAPLPPEAPPYTSHPPYAPEAPPYAAEPGHRPQDRGPEATALLRPVRADRGPSGAADETQVLGPVAPGAGPPPSGAPFPIRPGRPEDGRQPPAEFDALFRAEEPDQGIPAGQAIRPGTPAPPAADATQPLPRFFEERGMGGGHDQGRHAAPGFAGYDEPGHGAPGHAAPGHG
ncbi:hypothetical protein RKE29_30030, partial [Streptomyces sp. B1866]|nr:hypothetical protein [Streptomyces sp. B1866]